MKKILLMGLACLLSSQMSFALPNPYSIYCKDHGGESVIDPTGRGLCVFRGDPDTYCTEKDFAFQLCQPGQNVYHEPAVCGPFGW